ncbi:PREDICTED: organic cation transporter protein-like [Papilio xuthus]|uniref:Organic cation transporter protein-like n=1 Tax=Papilio xuthus TaxID=66420 RepID=A0AAJ6ZJ57_PAPXU|nr:PREDICTED: organic cation transporter protein-like [Papilio xuthus]
MTAKKTIDLDHILTEVGEFGTYQLRLLSLVLVAIIFSAIYNSQYIFAVSDLQYRCMVPQCETWPADVTPGTWGAWALTDDKCRRKEPVADTCSANSFHPTNTQRCDKFVYEHNNTIVAEFNLGCQEWKRTMVGTIHSAGVFVALPLTAYVSDTFGRRVAFIMTAVFPGVVGLARSFTQDYISYIILEFLDAVVGAGVYSSGFVLALEMVGINRRVLCGNIISSTFAVGQALIALIAWAVPYWRTLTRIMYAPSPFFIVYFFLIEESVRWLLTKGKKKRAAKIIFKAAEVNKKKLSQETIRLLTEETPVEIKQTDSSNPNPENSEPEKMPAENSNPDKKVPENPKPPSVVLQVLKSRVLMTRLCICAFWWVTVTFIYYGLSINSVSLAGNSYINYVLTSLIEIPGYALSVVTLDRFGRKKSIITAYFICGISLFALPFIPKSMVWLQTSLNLFGKLCISMVFSSIYVYTGELYPTGLRHRMLAACSMTGRIGQMTAPQTPLLMAYMESLPYILFGLMAGASGLLMLLTPETLRVELPDTIEQAESIAPAKERPVQLD